MDTRVGFEGRCGHPPRATQRGHIDNRPFLWILPILAAFAAHHLLEQKTGKGLFETLWTLPTPWPGFLASVAAVLVAGLAILALAAHAPLGSPFRAEPGPDGPLLTQRQPVVTVLGLWVATFGVIFLVFGLLGEGWFWGLIAALGVATAALATLPFLARTTWQLAPGEIVRRERLLGPARVARWEVPEPAAFTLDERTTGGAFGQPMAVHYRVQLGTETLFESAHRERAEALLEAIRHAYPASDPTGKGD